MDLDAADCCAPVLGMAIQALLLSVLAPTCESLSVITRYKCTGSAAVRVYGQFMDAVAGLVLAGCLGCPVTVDRSVVGRLADGFCLHPHRHHHHHHDLAAASTLSPISISSAPPFIQFAPRCSV